MGGVDVIGTPAGLRRGGIKKVRKHAAALPCGASRWSLALGGGGSSHNAKRCAGFLTVATQGWAVLRAAAYMDPMLWLAAASSRRRATALSVSKTTRLAR